MINLETSTSCTAASRARTLASQVKELVFVIATGKLPVADFGGKCFGSFAKLNHDGLWLKTSGGYCQSLLGMVEGEEGLEVFSETWPNWGIMSGGVCMELPKLAQCTKGREYSLLPTPLASDGQAWLKNKKMDVVTSILKVVRRGGAIRAIYLLIAKGYSPTQAAELYETMMGFPTHWTELEH